MMEHSGLLVSEKWVYAVEQGRSSFQENIIHPSNRSTSELALMAVIEQAL